MLARQPRPRRPLGRVDERAGRLDVLHPERYERDGPDVVRRLDLRTVTLMTRPAPP
jgi:hypothetical protein